MGKYSGNSSRSFNTLKNSKRVERSKRKAKSKYLIFAICIVVIAILLALSIFLIMAIAHSESPKSPKKNDKTQEISYQEATVSADDLYTGDLLLVNAQHKYRFLEESELVSASATVTTPGCVKNSAIKANATALRAFDEMMKKYVEVETSGSSDLYLTEAYRTEAEQKGKQFEPGYSDHHTGRLLRIERKGDDVEGLSPDNWLYQNCYKYGFIVRYPTGKSAQTGVSNYTEAFRYVGVAHATYMQEHNLCLEEYVVLLQNNYASGDLLHIDAADGNSYEVYYLRASEGSGATVSLPSNFPYTVSGDNTGALIVTVNLGKAPEKE